MGGTLRGRIECFYDNTLDGSNEAVTAQVLFKNIYDFFVAHPNATITALQHGSGTYGGTFSGGSAGTDFYDGTNPFQANAFFVVRMETSTNRSFPYYLLFQWAGQGELGNTPGDPASTIFGGGLFGGGDAFVGWSAAIGEGGDENPWNGTENVDGADTKGDPVWNTPSTGDRVHVFPRFNNPPGNNSVSKEGLFGIYEKTTPAPTRFSILADDDDVWIIHDHGNDGAWALAHFGEIDPRPNVTLTYQMMLYHTQSLPVSAPNTEEGGIVNPRDTAAGVLNFTWDRIGAAFSSNRAPNDLLSGTEYDLWPVHIFMNEGNYSYVGQAKGLEELFNVASGDTNGSLTKAFFGDGVSDSVKTAIPWDGSTAPGSGSTRTGTDF